jgi:GTP-binding protein
MIETASNAVPGTTPMTAPTAIRSDLRDIAIVAHVDHGKTTLVDAILKQTGAFQAHQIIADRVMDSGDLEREKGITILAKQTGVQYADIRLNIVDTPGHADFGGEVERSLLMVDSVLLLVDAAEGPLPQTRYVLQKAMALRLPVVVAINKIDRSDARPAEVVDAVYELFMDLGADEHQIDFPIVYTNARIGTATLSLDEPGTDLRPLLDLLVEHTPAPTYEPDHPLQMLVTNLAANDYVGRMAVGRIRNGTLRLGSRVSVVRLEEERPDGSIEPGRTVTMSGTVTSLTVAQGIERLDIKEAGPGEIVWLAGIPEVTIGDTVTDATDPRPLPRLHVDEPTLRMTFGVNTSPLSGRDGKYLTSRQIRARLDREVLGNVSIEIAPTDSPETFEVRGRGELQLAVLIEQMRREGYELQVSRPEVLLREVGGQVQEPYERITIDIPPEFMGTADDQRLRWQDPGGGDHPHPRARGLPRPVPDRDPGHGPAAPDQRRLRSVGGRGDPSHQRRARQRPFRRLERLRPVQPPGACHAVHRGRRGRLRGHDRGRELAIR